MTSAIADASAITTSWPDGFDATAPSVGGFAVREVAAPADAVFAWVRRLDLHPQFYPALRLVGRVGGPWPQLDVGSKARFMVGATFVPLVKVLKCDEAERSMAWGGGLPGLTICHGFTVKAVDEHRSLIRSEELWIGKVATMTGALTQGTMQKVQTEWAEAIARAATAHPGGPPVAGA